MKRAHNICRWCGFLTCAGVVAALLAPVAAQSLSPPVLPGMSTPTQPDMALPAVPDTYKIGPDDLLQVYVYQMPELSRQVRVDSHGTISLPLLQHPVFASGDTAPQVAEALSKLLLSEGFVRHPFVQITVTQVMSHPIVVSGAVKSPTVLEAMRPMSLLEVLSRAGGLTQDAGANVLVSRTVDGATVTHNYPVAALLDGSGAADAVLLDGGESVQVVPARMVYAVGSLGKPGAFPVDQGERLTVLKVLALAQGTSGPAQKSHSEIIRTDANGARTEIPVNLDKILQHRAPDLAMAAGDILYVPESVRDKTIQTIISDAGQIAVIAVGYNATKLF